MAATTSPPATPDAASLPKMPSAAGFWIGSLLIAVSIIGGAVAVGIGFGHLINLTAGEIMQVPGDSTRTLDAGKYKIYHSSSLYDPYDSYDTNPTFTIVGPDGNTVPVTDVAGADHSIYNTRSSQTIATFTAPTRGGYQIKTAYRPDRPGGSSGVPTLPSIPSVPTTRPRSGSGSSGFGVDDYTYPSTVRLAADDSEVAPQTVPWFLGGFLGGFVLFVVGLIVLIMTGVRRSRARKARTPPRPFGPGPGVPPWAGYPPPAGYPGGYPPPSPVRRAAPAGSLRGYRRRPARVARTARSAARCPGAPRLAGRVPTGAPASSPPPPGGPGPFGGPPPPASGFGPPR